MVFKTGVIFHYVVFERDSWTRESPRRYLSESLPWNVNIERPSNKLHIYCFDVQKRALDKRD